MDRLVIGDNGERFERRAREFSLLVTVPAQRPGEIVGGAEHPSARDSHQIDAASLVKPSQFFHHRFDVRPFRQALGDGQFLDRLRGGEDDASAIRTSSGETPGATDGNNCATLSAPVMRPMERLS